MPEKVVSQAVIKRLPRYYRYLGELLEKGVYKISSKSLSQKMEVTDSQIRQDLNCFGGFGQQGYGYNVELLHKKIGVILGLDRGFKTIIIGAGHLGHALAIHSNFEKRGFKMIGIFDSNPKLTGTMVGNMSVKNYDDLPEFVKDEKPDVAILTIPKSAVDRVAADVIELGIKGIWNFSYGELKVPEGVAVENVHLSDSLMTLSYKLTNL